MNSLPHLQKFFLIIGNARSGSTILGAALDAHPAIVCANESEQSFTFWRGLDGPSIVNGIIANAERQADSGRRSSGYRYQIGLPPSSKSKILVIGDKVWNPATLLLHGDYGLLPSLEDRLEVPVVVIHAVRSPFDTVTTMHMRSSAPISDRLRWFSAHCESVAAIKERLYPQRFLDVHHEDLVQQPDQELAKCCHFLGLPVEATHIVAVKDILFKEPRATRNHVQWTAIERSSAKSMIERFEWLRRYNE